MPPSDKPEQRCGAQDWSRGDDGEIIVYGTCELLAGHDGAVHRETRDGRVWAEWRGSVERAPAEQPKVGSEGRWTISGVRSRISPDRALMSVYGPEVIGTIEVVPASEVERLREALERLDEVIGRIGVYCGWRTQVAPDVRPDDLRRWVRAALHPDEERG